MKANLIKMKCAAQPDLCQPMEKCPEKAFTYIEDEDEPLGGRVELDTNKCSGCGVCISLCCGDCIELI